MLLSASRHSVVRVMRLENSKLANFHSAERVLSLYRTTTPVLSWKTAKMWRVYMERE